MTTPHTPPPPPRCHCGTPLSLQRLPNGELPVIDPSMPVEPPTRTPMVSKWVCTHCNEVREPA